MQGLLIYVSPASRAGIAILVCAVSVANLNYFQPYKSRVLFWLDQLSFITILESLHLVKLILVTTAVASYFPGILAMRTFHSRRPLSAPAVDLRLTLERCHLMRRYR